MMATNGRLMFESTFYDCGSLENITIPAGVTEIGNYAFFHCRSLKSIAFLGKLILCGGMTYTFSKAHNGEIGDSIVELDKLDVALGVEELAKKNGVV